MKQEIKERIELINKGIMPAGYKEALVGYCPIEWDRLYFESLYNFYGGLGVPREKLGNNGIPYLHYGDMHTSEKMYVDLDKDIAQLPKYDKVVAEDKLLLNGDIVFVDASEDYEGTCKTFVVYNKNKLPFISGLHTFFGRNKTSLIHIDFQKYLTKIPEIKKQIFKYVQGYKVYGISRENLQKVNINLPSYHEQEKIAEILDCATRQVELQEQLVDKLKVQKKALMQKLLTPQPDWQKDKLEKLINEGLIALYRGKVISKEDIKKFPGNYPIYSSSVINNGEMGEYGKYMFDEELITWSIDGGGNFFYRNKHKFSVTNVCGYIKINTNYFNYKFLAEELIYLHSKLSFDYMLKAHPSVIKKIYTINYPNLKEQTKIAKLALNLDKQIELQQKLLEQYKLRQKSLMQLLLTGIVRVC